jgi:DNA-binding NarL/FixJ family response regulator
MLKLARAGHCVPSCEARLRHPSGKERWVGVTVLVAGTGEGLYLVVLLRDTQRMHETLELAQALTRSPGRVARSDAKDQASDHSFPTPKLSPRQLEVLGLLAGGDSVKSIACELGIAEATARGHVQGLLQALGVRSQIEALAYARQIGLLPG